MCFFKHAPPAAPSNRLLLVNTVVLPYNKHEVSIKMNTKDIIFELRTQKGLSQGELADKLFVTRQAVSRWETGETTPNIETLKLLSKEFNVSINTLLGSPRQLVCQCCGMPLEDDTISKEPNGIFNEEYCKWCYSNGEYTYDNMDQLIDFCADHMAGESFSSEQAREYLKNMLPNLNYWKRHAELADQKTLTILRRRS